MKDYMYILLIVILLYMCILGYRREYDCRHCIRENVVHPECISPIVKQRFLHGGVYQ